jgi:ribosome-binding protein aMBF1 (putative translation factor)
MKEIGDMKLYTFEEVLDEHIGKPGTEERDSFEKSVEESVQAYKLGEAIRKARIEQHLTQSQLGERIGVKKAQISRLERGNIMSLLTMGKIFRALGVKTASVDFGGNIGKIALW